MTAAPTSPQPPNREGGPILTVANVATLAKTYLQSGISVFPLVPGTKKPLVKWEEYQSRLPTGEELDAWFRDGGANIGAVCGRVSGGLVALDFEDRQSFDAFFKPSILDETLCVETPHGGVHVWLLEQGEIPRRSIRICKDPPIDLLGEGGYGILPPSRIDHSRCDKSKCGRQGSSEYRVISKTTEVSKTEGVYDYVLKTCKARGWKLSEERPRVEEILPGVSEGKRNDGGFRYARHLLFEVGLDPSTALVELERWNAGNKPPLPKEELRTIWQSAQRYPPRRGSGADSNKDSPAPLVHLNQIEDPSLAARPVIVEGVVSSTSLPYLVPAEVEAEITDKDDNTTIEHRKIHKESEINLKFIAINEDVKYRRLLRLFGASRGSTKEKAYRTVYMVKVRPPVFTLIKEGDKLLDERGFEYKSHDVFVVSDTSLDFQPSTLIRMEGIPVPNPKTQKTCLLVYRVEFPEEIRGFDASKLGALQSKLGSRSVEGKLDWLVENVEKYAHIVGRRNLIFADLLCFFTPLRVWLNGENQRGWGNVLVIGDTTTCKSETAKKLYGLLNAGMMITAETASSVGLLGTATQTDRGEWFVDWGFLVLQDRKLLAIDGAHKLSASNWAALAESERQGIVTLAKAAKGTAHARTRQIKVANAVDREADKYTTKSLGAFVYRCQAIPTILDKTSIARLDLAVFSDQNDVSPEEINKRMEGTHDPELTALAEALKWCWSDQAEVVFEKEAEEYLLGQATELYKMFFCEAVPLVSIDLKWKLARLSVALAYVTLSTEDFKTVRVTKEHVEALVAFIKKEYTAAGLNILAQRTKHETLTEEDVQGILDRIQKYTKETIDVETVKKILCHIVEQGRTTKDELQAKFGLSDHNEVRPLLSALGIEKLTRSGKGYYPEPKLIEAYKLTEGFARVATFAKVRIRPPHRETEKTEPEIPPPAIVDDRAADKPAVRLSDEDLQRISEYLEKYPSAGIDRIFEDLGISADAVRGDPRVREFAEFDRGGINLKRPGEGPDRRSPKSPSPAPPAGAMSQIFNLEEPFEGYCDFCHETRTIMASRNGRWACQACRHNEEAQP